MGCCEKANESYEQALRAGLAATEAIVYWAKRMPIGSVPERDVVVMLAMRDSIHDWLQHLKGGE